MPKIPTFTARGRPTADAPGVTTGIQVSPTATTAAGLLPALNTLTNYAIKKRDVAEKVQANKKVFEIKGELDKYLKAEQENIDDENAINNFKTKYNNYVKQELGLVKNNRIKKRIQQNLDLEYSEYVYNIKKNSYAALEKNAIEDLNNNLTSLNGKYISTTDNDLKLKYKQQAKNKILEFSQNFELPQNVLDKKLEALDRDFLLADMQQFAGNVNGAEQIKSTDTSLGGEKILNNDDFGKGVLNGYKEKISEITVKGDPNSDYDRALELIDELKEFERDNGYKIKTGNVSVEIDNLEQKIINEKISHDKIVKNQGENKLFFTYADDLKNDLSKSIADPFGQPELTDRLAATEIEQEFDKRIKEYILANPDATLAEKRAYARSTTYVLQNKYEENKILKTSVFNLQLSDTDVVSQYNDTVNDMNKLAEGTLDQDTIESYESLARANGYQDIQSFINDWLPILKSQLPEG